jgi:hypothetical protein
VKEKRSHIGYLEALLAMESEERDRHAVQKRLYEKGLNRRPFPCNPFPAPKPG